MPEAAPWKFRKILRPLFETNKENILFKLRVIEPKTRKVIENGFVEIEDGKISKEEREAARDALRAKIEEKRLARFAEVDTDGDGSLSADEFGAIGSIERLAKWSPKSIARIFARLDDDENEGISADEFTLHLRHCRHHKGKGWGWGKRPKGDKDDDNGEEPADDNGEEPAEDNGEEPAEDNGEEPAAE